MKRIALNCRFTGTAQPTGTQTVAFHLFDQIINSNQEDQFVAFADSRFAGIESWKTRDHVTVVGDSFSELESRCRTALGTMCSAHPLPSAQMRCCSPPNDNISYGSDVIVLSHYMI